MWYYYLLVLIIGIAFGYMRSGKEDKWGLLKCLILRVLRQMKGRVVYLPQVLVRMRTGGASNRTLVKIMRKSWEDYLVLSRNGFGGPVGLGAMGAVAWKNLSKLPQFFQRG